jgi:autotransporter-associated beta strand protein
LTRGFSTGDAPTKRRIDWPIQARASTILAALVLVLGHATAARAQRVFGLDTSSAANTSVSQAQWNAAYSSGWSAAGIPSFQFAFVRSNHGLSDDSQFYTNISRATTAGMLAGSYNFVEPDSNSAVNEANHYLAHAGMYMKPGYLLPVLDLESGAGQSQAALTQWSLDYINTLFAAKGVNPIVYTNSSYNNDEVTAAVAFTNTSRSPHTGERTYQWLARPSGSLTTGNPGAASGYPDPYGGWDPNFTTKSASTDPAIKPWAFWQNGSAHIAPSGPSGQQFLVDFDAANGNIEFVKDFLVPALWTNSGGGNWGTVSNWNSDNPGYVAGNTASGPAPRLPNNSNLDWVKLQNAGDGTVTISSGAQTVRKFYTQQPLNITGGSLTVSYVPGSGGKWDMPSEFNAAVTLSPSASYSARTTQVDGGGGVLNINGGTVTFNDVQLASHASNAGKIVIGGDATFNSLGGVTSIIRSTGSLAQAGSVILAAGNHVLTVNNGSSAIDLSVQAAVTGSGGLEKAGPGMLVLSGANTYTGNTAVQAGTLKVSNPTLADGADMLLSGGAGLGLTFAGTDTIHALFINGVSQPTGIWGAIGSGAQFESPLITGTGMLQVTAFLGLPLAGDFNADGHVDSADLAVWQANSGATSATHSQGDANGDGVVDGADYLMWQGQLGSLPTAVAAAVPEPAAAALMVACGALLRASRGATLRR